MANDQVSASCAASRDVCANAHQSLNLRRTLVLGLGSFGLLGLAACSKDTGAAASSEGKKMDNTKTVIFSVNLHSYIERPIFDVYLNGKFIGDTGGQPARGHGGIMTGVEVPLGPQVITWRLDGVDKNGIPLKDNGQTVKAKNQPILSKPDPKLTYLGVHIYPDNTVELVPEEFWPEKTPKGLEINRQWELSHGQR